jgi:hypothetical protein
LYSTNAGQRSSLTKEVNPQVIEEIVAATERALRAVAEPRFWRTERGFQGRFYCALQQALDSEGLLPDGRILEMEYQKSARHSMNQRPDILLHVPAEESKALPSENNFAVWALKRDATLAEASDDFEKLDQMFDLLSYPVGVFVNIAATNDFADAYHGRFPRRLRAVAVSQTADQIITKWGVPRP